MARGENKKLVEAILYGDAGQRTAASRDINSSIKRIEQEIAKITHRINVLYDEQDEIDIKAEEAGYMVGHLDEEIIELEEEFPEQNAEIARQIGDLKKRQEYWNKQHNQFDNKYEHNSHVISRLFKAKKEFESLLRQKQRTA